MIIVVWNRISKDWSGLVKEGIVVIREIIPLIGNNQVNLKIKNINILKVSWASFCCNELIYLYWFNLFFFTLSIFHKVILFFFLKYQISKIIWAMFKWNDYILMSLTFLWNNFIFVKRINFFIKSLLFYNAKNILHPIHLMSPIYFMHSVGYIGCTPAISQASNKISRLMHATSLQLGPPTFC